MSVGDNVLVSGPSRLTGQSLAGQTIAQIRRAYGTTLNIPPGATATINNVSVPETQVITNGEELVFAKPLGQKG